MSNGALGKTMTVAARQVIPYTVPSAAEFATISINLVNTNATTDAKVKVAITTSATPSKSDYVDYGTVLAADGGVLERTCIVVSPGENVIIESDSGDVAVRVYGLEKI